jgi:hypothetical protein
LLCLIHYLAGNPVADGINLSLLGITHFLNYTQLMRQYNKRGKEVLS